MFNVLKRFLSKNSKTSIDKFFPETPKRKVKEWEKRGVDKDEFFRRKYSFMKDESKVLLKKKIDREKRYKDLKSSTRREDRYGDSRYGNDRYSNNRYGNDRFNNDVDRDPLNKSSFYEYVYGTHSVLSALKAQKRYLYNRLFMYNPKEKAEEINKYAKKYGIKIEQRTSKNDLNILTNNAVHNGVVLETRKLQVPDLLSLGDVNAEDNTYEMTIMNDESKESVDKSVVRQSKGYPFALYLDEITDPQNIGAIIRSAFYLGVDFIITPDHNTAKLGPAASKASAGALDLMDIYQVSSPLKFLRNVAEQTPWRIVSTDLKPGDKNIDINSLSTILEESPIILVLGSEGEGVRANIKNLSDFIVKINKNRSGDSIVDSMNVNAATSVLLSKFLV